MYTDVQFLRAYYLSVLVPECPKHLIIKELKRAQNNTILALCYIVNEITNARNKHGTSLFARIKMKKLTILYILMAIKMKKEK